MREIYAAIAAAAVDVDAPRYPKGQAGVLLMTANRQIKVERTDTTKYSLED